MRLSLPYEEPACALNRLNRQFPSQIKLCASVKRGLCDGLELSEQGWVAKNAEQVHYVAVGVVEDFHFGRFLCQENGSAPGEGLAIRYVRGKKGNDPLRRS